MILLEELTEIQPPITWRAKRPVVRQNLTSEITAMEQPASGQTEMKDVFPFAAPFPVLGCLAEIVLLRRYLPSTPES